MSLDDPEYDETPWEEQFRHCAYSYPPTRRERLRAWWKFRGCSLAVVLFYALCFWLVGFVSGVFAVWVTK